MAAKKKFEPKMWWKLSIGVTTSKTREKFLERSLWIVLSPKITVQAAMPDIEIVLLDSTSHTNATGFAR